MGLFGDFRPVAVVGVPDRKKYLRVGQELGRDAHRADDSTQTYELAREDQITSLRYMCTEEGFEFKTTKRLYTKPDDIVPERERALERFNNEMASEDPVPPGVYIGAEVTVEGIELTIGVNGEDSIGVLDMFMIRQRYHPSRDTGFEIL